MELLLKTYSDKPSRLGVRYTYGFQAVKAYEELVRNYRGQEFAITLEPMKGCINLVLEAVQSGKKIPYKNLDYRPELLKKLESLNNASLALQFVHLYSETGAVFIAKPFKKTEFFSLTHYQIIGAQNYF